MKITKLVRIYPNAKTRKFLIRNIKFSQEIWNKGIDTWENMYKHEKEYLIRTTFIPNHRPKNVYRHYPDMHIRPKKNGTVTFIPFKHNPVPSGRNVRDYVIKHLSQTDLYPNVVIANTILYDLTQSYKAFFDPKRPDSKHPKIKYTITENGSYLDTQAHIKNGKIIPTANRLDPNRKFYQPIKVSENIDDLSDTKMHTIRFIHRDHKFFAAIIIDQPIKTLMKTGLDDAVDVNVDYFNSSGYKVQTTKGLKPLYNKIAYYQRKLAHKRTVAKKRNFHSWNSKRYQKLRFKLRTMYLKVQNKQHDIVQKFTNYLVKYHDTITIEDLDVKHMKMGIASKGLHRSMFGYFRQVITYKAQLFGRKLIIANKFYPSTQVCPRCGIAKTGNNKITLSGNRKHKTNHHEFICYYCGFKADRDEKVIPSLMRYNEHNISKIRKAQKQQLDYSIF